MTLVRFLLGIGVIAFEGFVFKMLWLWHIAPQFGVAEMGYWRACAINMIIGLVTFQMPWAYYKLWGDKEGMARHAWLTITIYPVAYTMALAWGYLFKVLA